MRVRIGDHGTFVSATEWTSAFFEPTGFIELTFLSHEWAPHLQKRMEKHFYSKKRGTPVQNQNAFLWFNNIYPIVIANFFFGTETSSFSGRFTRNHASINTVMFLCYVKMEQIFLLKHVFRDFKTEHGVTKLG